jgi:hypothetical protein
MCIDISLPEPPNLIGLWRRRLNTGLLDSVRLCLSGLGMTAGLLDTLISRKYFSDFFARGNDGR